MPINAPTVWSTHWPRPAILDLVTAPLEVTGTGGVTVTPAPAILDLVMTPAVLAITPTINPAPAIMDLVGYPGISTTITPPRIVWECTDDNEIDWTCLTSGTGAGGDSGDTSGGGTVPTTPSTNEPGTAILDLVTVPATIQAATLCDISTGMPVVADSFTGGAGTLQAHTGETGATWTKFPHFTDDLSLDGIGLVDSSVATNARYYASGTTASADYDVSVVYTVRLVSGAGAGTAHLIARAATGAVTLSGYSGTIDYNGTVSIYKHVDGGASTLLATGVGTIFNTLGSWCITFRLQGTTLSMLVDGIVICTVTDATYAAKGLSGLGVGPGTAGRAAADSFKVAPIP